MTATTDLLDAARKRWDQTKDDLTLAQHDVERVKREQEEVAGQLKELGYDPDGDLDGQQLREKVEGLNEDVASVEAILANGESALPEGEAGDTEPISSEG